MKLNENMEEVIKSRKVNISTKTQVIAGIASLGAMYILGATKGFKIGRTRGQAEGYTKATHDLAETMQRIVKGATNNQN